MRKGWIVLLLSGWSTSGAVAQAVYIQGGARATTIECAGGNWAVRSAGLGLDGRRSDVYLEASRSSRCGSPETRLLADVYQTFGSETYVNVRVVVTPDAERHPRSDVLVEAFRVMGREYETSLQARQMQYSGITATIIAPSLARYVGDRYIRAQVLGAKAGGTPLSVAATALLRSYYRGLNFVEVRVGAGREVIELPGALLVSLGYSVGVSADHRIGRVRFMPTAGWAYDQQLEGRWTVGLQVRVARGEDPR